MSRPSRHRDKWRIRWKDADGVRKSEVYDDYAEADRRLRAHRVETDEILAGRRRRPPPARTVADACDYWINCARAKAKRSYKNDISICKSLTEVLGDLKLSGLGREDGSTYIEERDDLEPKTIGNHLTLLTTILNYLASLKEPWLLHVPKFEKPSYAVLSKNYRYLRTPEEIGRFLAAARGEGEDVYMLYKTDIYTGLRAGELAGLEKTSVLLDRRLLMVGRSFTGPTKSGEDRPVPILDPIFAELEDWIGRVPGPLVFPNRDGRMLGKSARVFQEVLHRVLLKAGFPESESGSVAQRSRRGPRDAPRARARAGRRRRSGAPWRPPSGPTRARPRPDLPRQPGLTPVRVLHVRVGPKRFGAASDVQQPPPRNSRSGVRRHATPADAREKLRGSCRSTMCASYSVCGSVEGRLRSARPPASRPC